MNNYNSLNASHICGSTKPKYNWRRYCPPDLETVESIILPEAYAMFGNAVIKSLVETSIETYVYVKPQCHELVSFISFKTYPNLPALSSPYWTEWMQKFYNNYKFTSLNTYFVHWATWCDPAYRSFDIVANFKLLFEIIFTDHFSLNYIIIILPPGFSELKPYQILLQIATLYRIYPIGFGEGDNVQSLWVCDRSVFFEKIIIRRALAEDNDDLVEILDADCKELRELYGDYYIAEIVLNEDSTRKIIVAEYDNRAVGMICVNSEVNIDKFFEYFDLDPYHGLRKHTDDELVAQTETELEEADVITFSQFVEMDKDTTIKEVSEYDRPSEEMLIVPLDSEEDKNAEYFSNLMGKTYDIFRKFAFSSSSSSSESSLSEQEWTSDVSLLETRVDLEMAEAKQMKKNTMSATNLIWGQLSVNSSSRFADYKPKAKFSASNAMYPKQLTSESNAFIIELYGIRSDYNQRLTYLLLEAVFETFPSREYCLITMPTNYQAFPGLDYFIKPIPRQYIQFEHDLFLLYKYAFYGIIDVRIATSENMGEITEFLEKIPKSKAVLKSIEELLTNFVHLKYVINVYSNEMLIGLAILQVCNEVHFLRTNFEISSIVNVEQENRIESNGFLKYFTLVPMYRRKHDIIVAEFFRLTGFKRLFYFVKDSNKHEPHTTILPYLFPIRPRRRIVYHPEKLGHHVPPDYILQDSPLIALYSLSMNNLARKNLISARIVVVGPSTTALSFLETLIFEKPAQNFWYMNLVLISPQGHFEAMINENQKMALARPAEVYYDYKYLQLLSIRTWVNVVHGYVLHIDKHNKCITIHRDRQIKYDILYIFTGLEFGLPKLIPYTLNKPTNFLTVNSWHDAEILGIKISLIVKKKNKHNIIVYGRTIEAYCILNYLLQTLQNCDKNIVFVRPAIEMKIDYGTTTFNDEFVDEYIKQILISSNVKIYDGYQVTKWEVNKHDMIRTVLLESKFEICQLDCSFFISCEKKSVGFETIKAFNDSGLVFDGRLVINKSFQTNDPYIFAAGPVTKYRRMLYADAYRHEYFNSAEIGRELALRLVASFDPTFDININQDFPLVVQKFKMPVIVSCVLPSNLNYLYITPPGPIIPHKVAILKDNYGLDIITGIHNKKPITVKYTVSNENSTAFNKLPEVKPLIPEDVAKKPANYFRCHLNEFNLVKTIVCLTTNSIDRQNIINMYGKHEKLLNNLVARYEANLLNDLYEFFQNSWWFYAVAHDRFSCLQTNNTNIFLESMIFSDENLIKDIICLFKKNNNRKLTDERKLLIVGSYLYANQAKIENNVLEFLNNYRDELPMFISPENVDQFVKKLTLEEVFHGIEELFIKASEL